MKTVLPLILLFVAAVTVEAGLFSSRRAQRMNCAGMQMNSCAGANVRGLFRETRLSRRFKRAEARAAGCAGAAKQLAPAPQVECVNGVCRIR